MKNVVYNFLNILLRSIILFITFLFRIFFERYPSSQSKTELTREIVNAFPKLRSSQSPEGYVSIFVIYIL